MSRRTIPLVWADGYGRWHASIPAGSTNGEGLAVEAIKHQMLMRGDCGPELKVEVEYVRTTVSDSRIFREVTRDRTMGHG